MVNINDNSYYIQVEGLKGNHLKYHYKQTKDFQHVPPQVVRQWRTMVGMRRKIEKVLGKPSAEMTNAEIAQFVVDNWQILKKNDKKLKKPNPNQGKDKTIEDKYARYLENYAPRTANDVSSLRQLCTLEYAIEQLERAETRLLMDINNRQEVKENYINSIVNARLRYLSEYRQLQTMLGVDRLSREKAESETGGADYIRGLMRNSRELLESKSVKITCTNCEQNGTILQMGFILSHFGGWEFKGLCPKCNSPILLKP